MKGAVRELEDEEILIKGKDPRDLQMLDAGEGSAVDPAEGLIGILSGDLMRAREIPLVNRKKLYLSFTGQDTIPQPATCFGVYATLQIIAGLDQDERRRDPGSCRFNVEHRMAGLFMELVAPVRQRDKRARVNEDRVFQGVRQLHPRYILYNALIRQ